MPRKYKKLPPCFGEADNFNIPCTENKGCPYGLLDECYGKTMDNLLWICQSDK